MTTTATKVTTKWETKRTQETNAHIISSLFVSAYQTLSKYGDKAHQEFDSLVREHKINHYKSLGVKTPYDLVKAIAESEHNCFGSEVEISGDDKKASLKFLNCAVWNAMQKLHKPTPDQEAKMGEQCSANWTKIADAFGLKYEPKHEKDSYEMIFTTK